MSPYRKKKYYSKLELATTIRNYILSAAISIPFFFFSYYSTIDRTVATTHTFLPNTILYTLNINFNMINYAKKYHLNYKHSYL